jgi:hypothetical protein
MNLMNLTNRQKKELSCLKFFIHPYFKSIKITEKDIENYFKWSERGKKPTIQSYTKGFQALQNSKTWRDYHFKSWKEDINKGLLFLFELKEDVPDDVLSYL